MATTEPIPVRRRLTAWFGASALALSLCLSPIALPWSVDPARAIADDEVDEPDDGADDGDDEDEGEAQEDEEEEQEDEDEGTEEEEDDGEEEEDDDEDEDEGEDDEDEDEGDDDPRGGTGTPTPAPFGEDGDGDDNDQDDRTAFLPAEVIVATSDVGVLQQVQQLGYGILAVQRFDRLGLDIVRLRTPRGVSALRARTELAARFPALTLDVNGLFGLQQSASLMSSQAMRDLIAWPTACATPLTIGMVDTGVDAGFLTPGQPIVQTLGSGGAVADHGTAVASLMVGAPAADVPALVAGARLAVAGVADAEGTARVSALDLIDGLDWLVAQEADVITISLAGDPSRVLDLAIDSVAASGIALIAAAGNTGPNGPPRHPAAHPAVIAVTAIGPDLAAAPSAGRGDHIDLAAPGVGLRVAGPGGTAAIRSGTSFAAPIVAAAAALAVARGLPADSVRDRLLAGARDIGPPGRDPIYGMGLVQRPFDC